jgi:hypothetical protein
MPDSSDLLDDIRARVAPLKQQFPKADDEALESFICHSIDFEHRVDPATDRPATEHQRRRKGVLARLRAWLRKTLSRG